MKKEKLEPDPNTWPIFWRAKILDPGDGSGDQIVELPNELLKQLGWKVGESVEIIARGTDVILRRPIRSDVE